MSDQVAIYINKVLHKFEEHTSSQMTFKGPRRHLTNTRCGLSLVLLIQKASCPLTMSK